MIACPLCEALFTRYELALEYDFIHLAPLLKKSLRRHGRRAHDTRLLLDVSMYFTSQAVYRRWRAEMLNSPDALLGPAPRGWGGGTGEGG